MTRFRRFEVITFIAILLFLGSHSTELAFHSETVIFGIAQTVFAILFFIYVVYCIRYLVMKEIQDKYFTEFDDKSNRKLIRDLKENTEEE